MSEESEMESEIESEERDNVKMVECYHCKKKYEEDYPYDYNMCSMCGNIWCVECPTLLDFESGYSWAGVCIYCSIKHIKQYYREDWLLEGCDKYKKVVRECKRLKRMNRKLKLEIKYRPNGEGYKEAEEHFNSLIKKNVK